MRPAWLTFENVKWWVGTLAIPATLGFVSYQYERISADRVAEEGRYKLYSELLSKREEADAAIRRDVFGKVLNTYLAAASGDIDKRIVALEMLALNFHESFDLKPLFWQLHRQIEQEQGDARKAKLRQQLEQVAGQVKDRQMEELEVTGVERNGTISFDAIDTAEPFVAEDLAFEDPDARLAQRLHKRHFTVEVVEHDAANRRLLVRVHDGTRQWVFWVEPLDLPLNNYFRFSKSERFSVVLRSYAADSAQLTFVFFPSSRNGAKDRPVDNVLSDLLNAPR